MRLWDYRLLPYLPKLQLISQWRELNSIFKKQDNHILINYIYDYPKADLLIYSNLVIKEMNNRGYKIKNWENYEKFFADVHYIPKDFSKPFVNHHNNRYLLQCFYNLQEKFDRKQRDFDNETFRNLVIFVDNELNYDCNLLLNIK